MYTVSRVKAIATVLHARYTRKDDNWLCSFPSWLDWRILTILEAHGLATHKTGGPATYNHTCWYIPPVTSESGQALAIVAVMLALVAVALVLILGPMVTDILKPGIDTLTGL